MQHATQPAAQGQAHQQHDPITKTEIIIFQHRNLQSQSQRHKQRDAQRRRTYFSDAHTKSLRIFTARFCKSPDLLTGIFYQEVNRTAIYALSNTGRTVPVINCIHYNSTHFTLSRTSIYSHENDIFLQIALFRDIKTTADRCLRWFLYGKDYSSVSSSSGA